MKPIERHVFLILAALAFGLSAVCYLLLERDAPGATDEQYLSTVRQRVKEELRISANELRAVAEQLTQRPGLSFTELTHPTQYPYFIFRSGPGHAPELLYWSDYRFIPDYDRLAPVSRPRVVTFEQGNYIVTRERIRQGTDTLHLFSLVNLYRRFHNSNAYLPSGYNPAIFSRDPQAITQDRGHTFQAVYDNSSVFLFAVVPPRLDAYRNHSTPVDTVILATLGVVFLGLYVIQVMLRLKQRRRYEWGFVWLATYLVVLRSVMLYFGVPFLFVETDLFNPKYYASSVLVPSLGDLLLNAGVVAVLAFYWVNHYYRSRAYSRLLHLPAGLKTAFSLGCVVASYAVFVVCYNELNSIYEKSQFTLDITLNIRFSGLKMICLLVFIIISAIYFLLTHLLTSLFLRFNRQVLPGLLLFALGSGLAVGVLYALSQPFQPIFLLNGAYFVAAYIGQFPRSLYTFRYKTSLYLFMAAFVCAITTAYVVYNQEIRKQLTREREFGQQLLAENDEFGEFLMSRAQESIGRDADIAQGLRSDTLLVRERVQQRVKSLHLDKYFDKYDIEVLSFRADGRPLDVSQNATTLASLTKRYGRPTYRTAYPGVFFINEAGNQFIRQYVCFAPVRHGTPTQPAADTLGYVVLNLRLRSEWPRTVYPELLADTQFMQDPDAREYSYGIYGGRPRRLLYSTGSYNYERRMPESLLNDPALYSGGRRASAFQHVGQRGKSGRIVVVSAPEYPFSSLFSNFSFLYLLLVLTVILIIVAYAVNYGLSKFSINYSTRIQILLNVAFFLPLLLVIVIILSVISANYITNQENTYMANTRNIAANFLTYLDEHLSAAKRSKASMEEELRKIARDADIDINLFDTQGRLYSSTRPLLYEGGYLSKRINPEAYARVIEDKEYQVLLDESLGAKQYRTAYAGIKSYDGRLLGVLSVPYFSARPELDRQIIEVIASALSIFTGLFLFFLILSYFASRVLTKPLRLLTQKIRKTNLERPNDPLQWRSDDEIGLLIREYNRMLVKLEESKQELAQTEKLAAWREMAKQVAHEIKNPLTPMKLTLQQLQRTLPALGQGQSAAPSGGANEPARSRGIQRTFDSLLDQIDNLSDIATSFSDFAKMPMPKNEVFEITSVLNRAADLYADDNRIVLERQIMAGPALVVGDRQLFGRIITNLIINGIQSVPADRKPVLHLRLYTQEDDLQIEISDNGSGISETIRTKVFLPNFSTKRGGSGLGLAIAKRGVEHAGGTIWFETSDGAGTTFFLSVPLASATITAESRATMAR